MLGSDLEGILKQSHYEEVWFVSFSLKRGGLIRILPQITKAIEHGTKFHFIVGIDHNSTSIEALQELLKLKIDVKIVKDKSPARTFHPKIYLLEASKKRADLFIGSSNMTAGGFYTNYEANIHLIFNLTGIDNNEYLRHKQELDSFINPTGQIVQTLTNTLLQLLEKRKEVQHENTLKQTLAKTYQKNTLSIPPSPFGSSSFPNLPPIPKEYQNKFIKETRKKSKGIAAVFTVTEFYFQLNRGKSSTSTVPGEIRIPLAALKLDGDFWGWPDKYKTLKRRQGKEKRQYDERYAKWKIKDLDNPNSTVSDGKVRMYVYKERGEFRLYSRVLVSFNADEGDIIKIIRSSEQHSDYDCELIKRNNSKYAEMLEYCKIPISNSTRMFGFT